MLFNSYIFVFIFLPLCLVGWFTLNRFKMHKFARLFLFSMSLWFYAYFNTSYLLLILISIFVNYGFYILSKIISGGFGRKAGEFIAVIFNLGILFYFKYFDFFIDNLNSLFHAGYTLKNILLPLGISFFTFQQLSFVIDAFRGEVPDYDFLSYACFVTFFPQLIAGPIVTHDELVPQLLDEKKKSFDWNCFSKGLFIFTIGLSKKVLLADVLGEAANYGFAASTDYRWEEMTCAGVWVTMLSYTLQMYFDFSGYSDMAIGIGKMFNIDLPINFNSPYKAITIVDHWKRWHITLTRFLTKYVYFPLGGSRKGEGRTYLNIIIVYLLSGLWHGAGWTYIVWGGLHGAFNVLTRWWKGLFERIPREINWLITFLFINFGFIIFRSENIKNAFFMIRRALFFSKGSVPKGILESFGQSEFKFLFSLFPGFEPGLWVMLIFLIICILLVLLAPNVYEMTENFRPTVVKSLAVAVLLCWCVISFSGVSTFLYFNF